MLAPSKCRIAVRLIMIIEVTVKTHGDRMPWNSVFVTLVQVVVLAYEYGPVSPRINHEGAAFMSINRQLSNSASYWQSLPTRSRQRSYRTSNVLLPVVIIVAIFFLILSSEPAYASNTPIAPAGNTPADLTFRNCNKWQLAQFAVIPETGGPAIKSPVNNFRYSADGVWVAGNRNHWVKLPGRWPVPAPYEIRCYPDNNWEAVGTVWPFLPRWEPAGTAPIGYPF